MAAVASRSRALLILPIALAVCALMVLPGATLLGSAAASSPGAPIGAPVTGAALPPGLAPTSVGPASPSSLLSGIPAPLSQVPWIRSLDHQGPTTAPLTSLPNLQLLKHPISSVASAVNPFYVSQPAPLGLADYGLGASTYSYNTSHFLGQVTFNTPPNDTDPGSTGVIEPGGAHDGYVGNFYEFGVQLNTVATNMSIPGSDAGFFWTQNVVDWNDTGIHFVDDTFNLTSATQDPFYIAPGTIYSACNNDSAGVNVILFNYGGVFQCVGATIPVSAASYPVTLQLYNNASVNAQDRTQVSYGFRIVEAGTGKVYTGISDTVVFNSPGAHKAPPANAPGFSVDGFTAAPAGLFRDAEIDLVGDIGGDNSAFRAVNGSVRLEYSNASSGGFHSIPSGYNFGGDTGETSTGIADYWTPSHTLEINQGPAMLYGLWNAVPWASVKSGDIHLAGSIYPSYGFVFVSNTRAVLDPWTANERANMSWLPTTNTGTFSTYLPPLGAPWTTEYHVQAFAAGFAERNGTVITGSTTSYSLKLSRDPGTLLAPLYMYSNAQAASLAKAVTGSSAPPYDFNGLTVNMNLSFNHLNDYGYPTFVLFMAQGVSQKIYVNDTYQGSDSPSGNFYIYDFSGSSALPGMLMPAPATSGSLPYYTSGINIFDGAWDQVTNQTVAGGPYGLQVNLWQDSYAQVWYTTSVIDASGVFVGDSVYTTVGDVDVGSGATGVTDLGSSHTLAEYLDVTGNFSVGVSGLSSSDGTYNWISASDGARGVVTGDDYGAGADNDAYYYLTGTYGVTVNYLSASDNATGANISLSHGTTFHWVTASDYSVGIFVDAAYRVTVSQVAASDHSTGIHVNDASRITIDTVSAHAYSLGVYLDDVARVQIANVSTSDHSVGVYIA
jgi:Thermopsin/Periplasmic copper-binding protein (NosD)